MNWPQAEKAVRSGKVVKHRDWKTGTVVLWRGHIIRRSPYGNSVSRRFFIPPPKLWFNRGWEVVE